MFLSDLSIKRPVMISMLMLGLFLFGLLAYFALPLNLMPDAEVPYVTIQTTYVGAAPEQIESLITKKIEDEISSISLLKSITSYSLNSTSLMVLEFDLDKDPDIAFQDTKEKVDAIVNDLPEDADEPIVSKLDITSSAVMEVMLSGDIEPTELFYIADTTVKDRLSQIQGVGSVDLQGGFEREIRVEFDNKTVYENSLNLTQISAMLASANMDMPGGNFQNQGQDYSVSLDGEITDVDTLQDLMIPTASGMRKLGQLATIDPASEDVRERVTLFDTKEHIRQNNAILLGVIKSSEGNPVSIAEDIREILPDLQADLPESVHLTITSDDSDFIEATVNDTLDNIILGIVFTALILLFFLHDLRSTLIVALAMPLSIIPTFLILNQIGITLNIMSLMGLSTSVGVLVMNSVVVLENIFRHKSMGHSRKDAASKGTAEVTVAVVASTLTNVAVFLPLGTMDGIMGIFIRDFALTVVVATLFSLLVSFTLTPMMASLILPEHQKKKMKISRKIEDFFKSMERGYVFLLEKILHNRLRSILLILGTLLLFIAAMAAFSLIPFEFVPQMDSGRVSIQLELPQDASLEQTAALIKQVEDIVSGYDEVEQIVTTLGSLSTLDTGTNLAVLEIQLNEKHLRNSNIAIASRIGSSLSKVPGVIIRTQGLSGMDTGGSSPVSFYLQGNDVDELLHYTDLMKEEMAKIPGTTGINSSMKTGKPEIKLIPNRQQLSEMGVTLQDIAMSMRGAIDGVVTTQLKADSREYDIRVTLPDTDVSSFQSIRNIPVSTENGIYPLSYFAEVKVDEGINRLLRIDKTSSIEITSNILPGFVLGEITSAVGEISQSILPRGVKLKWSGDADMLTDTITNMAIAFIIAILLTYMLLAAILEKVGQPLLILSTVPLSLIGVVAIFLIGGFSMNMVSMMAIVMLIGMVVNNAILILEYSNQLRAEGKGIREALLVACPTKLQPILMSNIATMLGMLPMAMGIGTSGAELRQPMGLVSIGGLLAATFLTLFVIPAAENALESGREEKKKKRQAAKEAKDAAKMNEVGELV